MCFFLVNEKNQDVKDKEDVRKRLPTLSEVSVLEIHDYPL